MKKFILISIFMFLTVLFSGCLQVETTLIVKKDGSGTINEKVVFSKTFVNMIEEFAQAFQDSTSTDEFNIYEEENIIADAKNYGENVVYVSHEKISTDNWEGYKAVYSFDDVTKLKLSPDPDSRVDLGDQSDSVDKDQDYYYFKFVKGDTPELIIDRPDIDLNMEGTEEEDSVQSQQNDLEKGEEFVKMMEGMKIDIAVEVEGEIVNTNATNVVGSRVTLFQMDFSEMMKNKEAFKEFKKNEPKNIEEIKLYLDKLNGIKLEVEKPITIKFK